MRRPMIEHSLLTRLDWEGATPCHPKEKRRWAHAHRQKRCLLAKERKDSLAALVGLRQHRGAGLLQDVELRELRHLRRHVDVADAGLGGRQVLLVGRQVVQAMLEAGLAPAVRRKGI